MAAPAITSIAPTGGSLDGGTAVVITGTGLGTPTAVAFGSEAATSFAGASATQVFAVAPAGTGTVHVAVTTGEGTSPESTADQFTYGTPLFTVAEARAFDKLQLASATTYPAATIIAKEIEIRDFLAKVCCVDFITTTHTDEYHDGDSTGTLMLDWPKVTSITAASTRSDTTWTDLDATELGQLQVSDTGIVYWDGSYWPRGTRNLKLTYTAGYTAVPTAVKRAALLIAATELPTSNVTFTAESYEGGGMQVSFAEGDGYRDNWSRIAEVRRTVRLYTQRLPGVA
jgi:hypothetical protein